MSWPTVELQEVCKTGSGTTPPRKRPELYEGCIPWVKSGELRENEIFETEEHVSEVALNTTSLKLVPAGALLVAMYGATVGRVGLLGIDATTNQAVCHVIPDPKKADRYYMFHLLQARAQELVGRGVGGAQPNISQGTIKQLKIPLPPLEEQRRIAGILDQADALRRLRTRALDKLNTLGQAIFHEMFEEALQGDFFEFGRAVEEFRYGTSRKSGDAGLPTLRIPNVIGGGIDTTEIKTVEVTGAELERLRLRDGDVLFVRTNGNPDYVGRCAAFSFAAVADYDADADWIFASYLIRARLSDRINPAFAKTYFTSLVGRSAVRERCKTSAGQYNINTEGLASLPFPDVPRADQDKFAEVLAAIEPNSAPMKQSAAKMDKKFASLQYRAFKGEL